MELYLKYAKGMNARDEVLSWINSALKNRLKKTRLDQIEVEHILDYLVSDSSPSRLMKMSYEQAKSNADKWTKAQQKKGKDIVEGKEDMEVLHEFDDGSKIVKLISKKSFQREGHLMRHCLGGYSVNSDQDIYSYRDSKNMPHATFEIRKNENEVIQIKGKGNGPIHPRYIDPILKFLELLDQDIRPDDMKNLGYFHIHEDLISFAKNICPNNESIVDVRGENYVYETA